MHYLPGALEAGKQLKFSHKKRKILRKSGIARSYDLGTDFAFTHIDDKVGTQQSVLMENGLPTVLMLV